MALIANVNRDPKVTKEAFTAKDWMYDYNAIKDDNTTTKERDNWEKMKQTSKMWVQAMEN